MSPSSSLSSPSFNLDCPAASKTLPPADPTAVSEKSLSRLWSVNPTGATRKESYVGKQYFIAPRFLWSKNGWIKSEGSGGLQFQLIPFSPIHKHPFQSSQASSIWPFLPGWKSSEPQNRQQRMGFRTAPTLNSFSKCFALLYICYFSLM